jgi:flagellar P-ring protein FlgI
MSTACMARIAFSASASSRMRCAANLLSALTFALAGWLPPALAADTVRIKDLGKLQGWRENALVGQGIVTGLAGTGDSPNNRATRQAMSNVMSQFNLNVAPEQMQSRNVAVVMVSAALPAFARPGDALDITVTSTGDARSLVGGNLLLTPLKAANGRVYALAQGALSVGGYRYDANGNVVQKNHPTVGAIPGGATVEVGTTSKMLDEEQTVTFILAEADYTTASRVAAAINQQIGPGLAQARDATGIEIKVPAAWQAQPVGFFAQIEAVAVEPDRRAKVVINERTGTVVSGGDVRLASVSISHGDIKISIATQHTASQPANAWNSGAGVRTAIVTNTQVEVDDNSGATHLDGGGTVADLVRALAKLKTSTRDIISILRAVKTAGAMRAELVIQ